MPTLVRTLNIQWKDIGKKPFYILFAFTPPPADDLTEAFKPVAWSVVVARGTGWEPVTYVGNFGFGQSTSRNGNMLLGHIQTPIIGEGQAVDLITVDRNVTAWDTPSASNIGKLIVAKNRTDTHQSMSVGSISDEGEYGPMLFWDSVAPTMSVKAKIHPILRAYVNTGYQRNEIIDAELMKDTPLWEGNLSKLGSVTTLQFTLDDQGTPEITQL